MPSGVKLLRAESSRSAPSHALAVAHASSGQTGIGGGTRDRGRKSRRSDGRHDDGGGRHQQGHPQQMHQQQQQQHQPPAAMSQQSYAWQQQQQQQQYPPPFSQGPHHQQPNPGSSRESPPHQQQRGRAHHQRTPRHRRGHQAHQQRVLCKQCGNEEHFPADCVITMPAPAPQYTAQFSGARPGQYGTGAHVAKQKTARSFPGLPRKESRVQPRPKAGLLSLPSGLKLLVLFAGCLVPSF